jgi:cobalt transporter subunit CbtB
VQSSATLLNEHAISGVQFRRAPLAAMLFGAVILYVVGFLNLPLAHNATHDARHAAGFPCH